MMEILSHMTFLHVYRIYRYTEERWHAAEKCIRDLKERREMLPSLEGCANGTRSRVHSQFVRCSSPIPEPAQEDVHPLVCEESCALEAMWYLPPDIYISEREKRECVNPRLNKCLYCG